MLIALNYIYSLQCGYCIRKWYHHKKPLFFIWLQYAKYVVCELGFLLGGISSSAEYWPKIRPSGLLETLYCCIEKLGIRLYLTTFLACFRSQKDVDFDQLLPGELVPDWSPDDHPEWPLQLHLHARQPLAFRWLLLHCQQLCRFLYCHWKCFYPHSFNLRQVRSEQSEFVKREF